jgi:hypothetical protein
MLARLAAVQMSFRGGSLCKMFQNTGSLLRLRIFCNLSGKTQKNSIKGLLAAKAPCLCKFSLFAMVILVFICEKW